MNEKLMAAEGGNFDILGRINAILLAPATEWKAIEQERNDLRFRLTNYVAILASIPAVAGFIGFSAIGVVIPSGVTIRVPVFQGLIGAVFGYLMAFVTVYILAAVTNILAPRFGARRDFASALKLIVFSFTAVWIAGIFLLIPGLWFLTVLGLYGVYSLWRGLPQLMKTPEGRSLSYTATIVLCALIIRGLVAWVEAGLFSLPQVI